MPCPTTHMYYIECNFTNTVYIPRLMNNKGVLFICILIFFITSIRRLSYIYTARLIWYYNALVSSFKNCKILLLVFLNKVISFCDNKGIIWNLTHINFTMLKGGRVKFPCPNRISFFSPKNISILQFLVLQKEEIKQIRNLTTTLYIMHIVHHFVKMIVKYRKISNLIYIIMKPTKNVIIYKQNSSLLLVLALISFAYKKQVIL